MTLNDDGKQVKAYVQLKDFPVGFSHLMQDLLIKQRLRRGRVMHQVRVIEHCVRELERGSWDRVGAVEDLGPKTKAHEKRQSNDKDVSKSKTLMEEMITGLRTSKEMF